MTYEQTLQLPAAGTPVEVCRLLRRPSGNSVLFHGAGFSDGWVHGPLLALDPEPLEMPGAPRPAILALDRLWRKRKQVGGTSQTGVAVLLSYELFRGANGGDSIRPPVMAWQVDRSLGFGGNGQAVLRVRRDDVGVGPEPRLESDRLRRELGQGRQGRPAQAAQVRRSPRTSLPHDEYLRAVERLQRHIAAGDIYQANLCQRFYAECQGDPFELFARLSRTNPAPHSAWIERPGFALASVSPETFLRGSGSGIETWPIKGTRPRGESEGEDRRIADELRDSPKDRAELLMIVDLERNDLSRVCVPGSVTVDPLWQLRSFATVHHLVAGVRGRLRPDVGLAELLDATFPGGSISGAPKIRAMDILRSVEPVPRGFFTGTLLWLGDDGSMDSSILIRTVVFDRGCVELGAGGGIVADSTAELEWGESNQKARGPAAALGFVPEEAT